jgi:hypothetical protein
MKFDDWYTRQFAEILSEPLTGYDGLSGQEIEQLLGDIDCI